MNQALVSKARTVWLPSTLYLKIKLATTWFWDMDPSWGWRVWTLMLDAKRKLGAVPSVKTNF